MDSEKNFLFSKDGDDIDYKIKEYLRETLEPEIYQEWIEDFTFEKNGNKIVAMYYGFLDLKKFKKNYKEAIWLRICSSVGYVKKFEIIRGKQKKAEKVKKAKKEKKSGREGIAASVSYAEDENAALSAEYADESVSYAKSNEAYKNERSSAVSKRLKIVKLFLISLVFAGITLAVAILGGSYIVNRNFIETFYSAGSLNANGKIRIIQISDLHTARYGANNKKLIDRVKKLKPDIIVYTGDCVDSSASDIKNITGLIRSLKDIAHSYYVYGNNEVERVYGKEFTKDAIDDMLGFNDTNRKPEALHQLPDSLEAELEAAGVKVLKDEYDSITINKTDVEIFGVLASNSSAFWDYAGEKFIEYCENNTNKLKITLVHEPFIFEDFQHESWGDVMLCGHTHGGTVRLPIIGPLYTREGGILPEKEGKFVYGRYEVAGSPLIVSSGLENNDLLRINNQPELVIVDINRF